MALLSGFYGLRWLCVLAFMVFNGFVVRFFVFLIATVYSRLGMSIYFV